MICQDVPGCTDEAIGSTPRFMGSVWSCGQHGETTPTDATIRYAPVSGDYVAAELPGIGLVNGIVTAIITSGDGSVSYQLEYAVHDGTHLIFGVAAFGIDQLRDL